MGIRLIEDALMAAPSAWSIINLLRHMYSMIPVNNADPNLGQNHQWQPWLPL
jgi:hypothetical protein